MTILFCLINPYQVLEFTDLWIFNSKMSFSLMNLNLLIRETSLNSLKLSMQSESTDRFLVKERHGQTKFEIFFHSLEN